MTCKADQLSVVVAHITDDGEFALLYADKNLREKLRFMGRVTVFNGETVVEYGLLRKPIEVWVDDILEFVGGPKPFLAAYESETARKRFDKFPALLNLFGKKTYEASKVSAVNQVIDFSNLPEVDDPESVVVAHFNSTIKAVNLVRAAGQKLDELDSMLSGVALMEMFTKFYETSDETIIEDIRVLLGDKKPDQVTFGVLTIAAYALNELANTKGTDVLGILTGIREFSLEKFWAKPAH